MRIWSGAEEIDIAVGSERADDTGAGRSIDGKAEVADRDFAIVADADAGSLTKDKRPPGAGRDGAQDGAILLAGQGCPDKTNAGKCIPPDEN